MKVRSGFAHIMPRNIFHQPPRAGHKIVYIYLAYASVRTLELLMFVDLSLVHKILTSSEFKIFRVFSGC